ncbi:MAG: teichoic acid biosynthesis protein [Deltaproteobacteria bacterium]|nr:teichoic acid biosynthesis protein [Deltaproteobacteria bacterium]
MKILYGVVGEGMGHAMRSRVVLSHLLKAGHEVEIMVSGRAADFLQKHFEDVHKIHGMHMIFEENRIRLGRTLWSNVLQGVTGVPRNIAAYFDLINTFRPEVVISDFESWTYLFGKTHGLPIISIDNMQIINRCEHPEEVLKDREGEFQLAKAFVKAKLPFCNRYLITTFFRPPLRKPDTSLHPPILRDEILAARPTDGEHLLVYQTAAGHTGLAEALASTGMECRIYGMRKDLTGEVVEGSLRYRPFSEKGFVDDLASARGVLASAGFTLMGEAVYLKKPMLAVPLAGQFEQTMNARYLQRQGYGLAADHADDPAVLRAFLDGVPRFRARLEGYTQDGNRSLLSELDQLLDRAAAGVL